MAVFTFFDKINKVNVPCASLHAIGLGKHLFQRMDNFEHKLSNEVYFKKTDNKNEANIFVYDRWYQATDFEIHEHNIEVKNYIEKDPFKEDTQSSMKNVVQVIGNNNTFSGNNFNVGDISLELFFKGLEGFIEENSNIRSEEKKNLLSKIKDLANNPYISGTLVNSLFTYVQPWLPKL